MSFDRVIDVLASNGKYAGMLKIFTDHVAVRDIYSEVVRDFPRLSDCMVDLLQAHECLVDCFCDNKKLMLCGNGGSYADCLHISGELLKSFTRDRKISPPQAERLKGLPFGDTLIEHLEGGFPVVVLGANGSLASAVLNDCRDSRMVLAQECFSLGMEGDVLLCLSTSGKSENVQLAASTARSLGMQVIALTGKDGGPLAEFADIAIRVPGETTAAVQQNHVVAYHALCEAVEAHFYPRPRTPYR